LRWSVTAKPAAIARPMSTLPMVPLLLPRSPGMSLIVMGRKLSGER